MTVSLLFADSVVSINDAACLRYGAEAGWGREAAAGSHHAGAVLCRGGDGGYSGWLPQQEGAITMRSSLSPKTSACRFSGFTLIVKVPSSDIFLYPMTTSP